MMFVAINISTIETSAITDRARREWTNRRQPSISIGLFEIDENGVGGEKGDHDRDEIDQIAQVDDAAGDRGEMAEDAGPGDGVDESLGCPAPEQPEHRRGP